MSAVPRVSLKHVPTLADTANVVTCWRTWQWMGTVTVELQDDQQTGPGRRLFLCQQGAPCKCLER